MKRFNYITVALIFSLISGFLGGCLAFMQYDEPPPPPVVNPEKQVRLRAGDVISLYYLYNVEFQSLLQGIRDDGKVSLPLLGEVHVEGMTPGELKRHLERRYSKYVDRVSATVVINTRAPKQVYMAGAVGLNQLLGFHGQLV